MYEQETYSLAHTARCKLQMAADRPDRDLRFILGHAFTLDKLMLRVIEIESGSSSDDDGIADVDNDRPTCTEPRVSFRSHAKQPTASPSRRRSPPPATVSSSGSSSSDEEDIYEDDDEEETGLSLRRFESATTKPPRMIDDNDGEDEDDDEDEPHSPLSIPSQAELEVITGGMENEFLADVYRNVQKCPCHGKEDNSPIVTKMWDVPQKDNNSSKRLAIVQVES